MAKLLRPSDRLVIPNLLTKIPVGKGRVLYSPPNPGPTFGALPFQVQVNQIGQVTCDFNPQGIVVTNPYNFYIYFPDAQTWAPPFYGNFIVPYAPSPGAIIRFDSTVDTFGNAQTARPQLGPASCTITTDLSQYTGGGSLGVSYGTPYVGDIVITAGVVTASGWGPLLPWPNNHVIIGNSSSTSDVAVGIGTSPTNYQQLATLAANAANDYAPIYLPAGWDIYLLYTAASGTTTINIAAY